MNLTAASIFVIGYLCIGLLSPARADTITGKVTRVIDGDTIEVLTDRDPVRVRLEGIDAPELHQPFGRAAKQGLADRAFGRRATVGTHGKDRYGRTIGSVTVGGQDVGLDMVRNGLAWAYRAYLPKNCTARREEAEPASTGLLEAFGGMCPILAAEADARAHARGLWGLQADQRIAPWEWRHR